MPSNTPQSSSDSGGSSSLGSLSKRTLLYFGWILASCLLLSRPLEAFVSYSLANDNASHLLLIPVISAWVLFLERDRIFKTLGSDIAAALAFLACGGVLAVV